MSLPPRFQQALDDGRAAHLCDVEVHTPEEHFARGVLRASVNQRAEARSDFERARDGLPLHSALELALLDLRDRRPLEGILGALEEVLAAAEAGSAVRARALHVQGRALAQRPPTAAAVDSVLSALDLYRAQGDTRGQAEAYDTLGMIYAFEGSLEVAAAYYAVSVARKTLDGDRAGAAITLGNLGRLLLEAGNAQEALHCFELDLEIARTLEDREGVAKMLNDVGRAHLALDDPTAAITALEESIELSRRGNLTSIEVFAHKDLALALIAGPAPRPEDTRRAAGAIREAERLLEDLDDAFAHALVVHAGARVGLVEGSAESVSRMEEAVGALAELDVPDYEIPALLDLARAQRAQGFPAEAQRSLARALELARARGLTRHADTVREALAEIDVPEEARDEIGELEIGEQDRPRGGGYTILGLLGKGAFGRVYRALDLRRGQQVALKRLRLEELYDADGREAMRASVRVELKAAARVHHPGVARVYAIGTDDAGGAYVVQELIEGTPLYDLMPMNSTAPPQDVLRCAKDIAHALAALHKRGVVHRDLKPTNVLVRKSGLPVLIDMGIAYLPSNPEILGAAVVVGTLDYMAPEQARALEVDGRADVYALGVIVFEWLTGFLPRDRPTGDIDAMIGALRDAEPHPVERFRDDLPASVGLLLREMLDTSARQRPEALQVAKRLEWVLLEL